MGVPSAARMSLPAWKWKPPLNRGAPKSSAKAPVPWTGQSRNGLGPTPGMKPRVRGGGTAGPFPPRTVLMTTTVVLMVTLGGAFSPFGELSASGSWLVDAALVWTPPYWPQLTSRASPASPARSADESGRGRTISSSRLLSAEPAGKSTVLSTTPPWPRNPPRWFHRANQGESLLKWRLQYSDLTS